MSKTRVLIIDDEQDFAEALAERMRNREIFVATLFSGEDAVKHVETINYDAVVLDLAMPGMDGIATLKAMLLLNKDLQVIILTGRGSLSAGVEAIKEGAFEFLEKPVKLDELVGKIDQAKKRGTALTEASMQDMIDKIIGSRGW